VTTTDTYFADTRRANGFRSHKCYLVGVVCLHEYPEAGRKSDGRTLVRQTNVLQVSRATSDPQNMFPRLWRALSADLLLVFAQRAAQLFQNAEASEPPETELTSGRRSESSTLPS